MNKWIATCTLDGGKTTFSVEVEANTYSAAYIKALTQLPSRCSRMDTNDGILDLTMVPEEASRPNTI